MRYILLVFCALCLTCCSGSKVSPLLGKPAPQVRLTLLNGELVPLSKFSGRTHVVLFWATWCNASRPVIEELNKFAVGRAGKPPVEFIAISVDKHEDGDRVSDRVKRKRLFALEHAFSGNENYDEAYLKFQVEEIPILFVIGPNGNVIASGRDLDDVRCAIPGERC